MTAQTLLSKRNIILCAICAVVYYGVALTGAGHELRKAINPLNLVFNSMLDHLVQGRFDVDASIVGKEGFLRDGKVFAYWGIFPSLLRLPLLIFGNLKTVDVTAWSCLTAVVLTLTAKLWTLRVVSCANPNIPKWLILAVVAVLIFSGAQISYLRISVYQEVCFWAGLFAAVFVAAGVTGIVTQKFSGPILSIMALAAGLALLTRVSVAVGLYAGLGLLLLVLVYRSIRIERNDWKRLVAPILILLAFLVICGFINIERWGNPLTFADYNLYIFNADFPDRLPRTHQYGLFNIARIPFGLMYFFFPIWCLSDTAGHLLFAQTQFRLLDAVELPPSSFFFTDALLLVLASVALSSLLRSWKSIGRSGVEKLAIACGLAASPLLMLTAISMNYRYRMDFYPLLEFLAFLGLIALAHRRTARPIACRWIIGTATAMSIVASHAALVLYRTSDLGPSQNHLTNGVTSYYAEKFGHVADRISRD